jgi:hypothetical protein
MACVIGGKQAILLLSAAGCSCVVRPHFFLSFYFWLDTVAVLSLAFELPALRAVLLLGATQVGSAGSSMQAAVQGSRHSELGMLLTALCDFKLQQLAAVPHSINTATAYHTTVLPARCQGSTFDYALCCCCLRSMLTWLLLTAT